MKVNKVNKVNIYDHMRSPDRGEETAPGDTPHTPPLQGVTLSQRLPPFIFFDVSGCHKAVTRVSQPVTGRHNLVVDRGRVDG